MSEKTRTVNDHIEAIRGILKDLLKVIKIVSLYPENNPLPQSLRRTFAERFAGHLEEYGDLTVQVFKDQLLWNEQTVFTDRSKEENLAGLFFDTGVTSISFGAALEVEQIFDFLDVLKSYMNAKGQKGDLVQILWEKSIPHLSFTTVEDVQLQTYDGNFHVEEIRTRKPRAGEGQMGQDLQPYDAIFTEELHISDDDSDADIAAEQPDQPTPIRRKRPKSGEMFYALNTGQGLEESRSGHSVDEATFRAAEAAMGLGLNSIAPSGRPIPTTAVILNDELKLTEEDEKTIAAMCAEDAEFDMFESTLELLQEMLLQENELPDFHESVTICEKLHADFLRSGKLSYAGALYVHLRQLEDDLRADRPAWADRLKEARVTAAGRERLHIMAETLNKCADITPVELHSYLNHFGWEIIGFLSDLLGELEHRAHRECLVDFLAERGKTNLPLVSKGMYDKRWFVVRNTVTILLRIGTEAALNQVKRAANHEEVRVRLELANALRECPNPQSVEILRLLVTDPDPGIRSAVIGALLSQSGPAALQTVKGIIHDVRYATLDHQERQLVLNAYAVMGGDEAIQYLTAVASKVTFWRDEQVDAEREAALIALAHAPGEPGEQALLHLARSWRPAIKQAAQKALKRRREIILAGHSL